MKLLLDENLPHDLRHHIAGHAVFTVAYMRWAGTRNGQLLRLAAAAGFDAVLTLDNGVAYQQNPATLTLSVVILAASSNDLDDLLPLVPSLLESLCDLAPCAVTRVP